MKYVYGALLLHEAKVEINEENLTKLMSSVDPNVDSARIKALIEALKGVNIDETLKSASSMQVAPSPAPSTETKKEVKKQEEKPKEEEKHAEEDAAAGLAALFG